MFAWDHPPRVVGHRGSPHEAPENTLASFEAALRAGAGAVELDARLSSDGRVVVHHDASLGRVLGGRGEVEETASDALAEFGVPLLADVLRLPLLLDVELKADASNAHALPGRVLDEVRRAGALDRVLVTSFDPELADAYARLSGRPAGWILPFPPEEADLASLPRLRFVALAEDAALPESYALLGKLERPVLVWTVNDPAGAGRAIASGAAAVVTDRPGPILRALTTAR